jgi:hypothetical protein
VPWCRVVDTIRAPFSEDNSKSDFLVLPFDTLIQWKSSKDHFHNTILWIDKRCLCNSLDKSHCYIRRTIEANYLSERGGKGNSKSAIPQRRSIKGDQKTQADD